MKPGLWGRAGAGAEGTGYPQALPQQGMQEHLHLFLWACGHEVT